MHPIRRGDEPDARFQVAVEVILAVFSRVDIETIGHKNPRIHHVVTVFHWFCGLLRVESHLELQGELVVDFCAQVYHGLVFFVFVVKVEKFGVFAHDFSGAVVVPNLSQVLIVIA